MPVKFTQYPGRRTPNVQARPEGGYDVAKRPNPNNPIDLFKQSTGIGNLPLGTYGTRF